MAYEPSTWLWLSFCFIAFSVLDQWSWWYSGMCTGGRQREGHKWHSCVVVTQPSPWMTNIAQHFRDCHAVPAAPSWPWGAGGSQPWKGPVLLNGAVSPWYRASSSSDFDAGSARLCRVDLRSDGHVPFATARSGLGVDLLWLVPLGYWNVGAAPKQTILKSQIFALMKHGYLEGLFFFGEVTQSSWSEFEVCHPVNIIDEIGRTGVSIEGLLPIRNPGGSSSPRHFIILVQHPAVCHVPGRGNMCPAASPVLRWLT